MKVSQCYGLRKMIWTSETLFAHVRHAGFTGAAGKTADSSRLEGVRNDKTLINAASAEKTLRRLSTGAIVPLPTRFHPA
jgi:hypothetical protein